MRPLIAMLCVAIAFMFIVDPVKDQTTANDRPEAKQQEAREAVDLLAEMVSDVKSQFKLIEQMEATHSSQRQEIIDNVMQLSEAVASLDRDNITRDEVVRLVSTSLAESDENKTSTCECNCEERLAALEKEVAELKASIASTSAPKSAAAQSSYGSTGSSPVVSYGSTGSSYSTSSYGSTGSAVTSTSTPVYPSSYFSPPVATATVVRSSLPSSDCYEDANGNLVCPNSRSTTTRSRNSVLGFGVFQRRR